MSHQLPIWTVRSKVEGRRLWHDPRRRQCSLASLTSFTYQAGQIVAVEYSEPAKDLLPSGSDSYQAGSLRSASEALGSRCSRRRLVCACRRIDRCVHVVGFEQ